MVADGCVETMEWSLIEHGVRQRKTYSPGVGLVLEDQPRNGSYPNELVSITLP
ncbi:MAG TPA: hypothetical protein VM347_14400 [Nonomuraea sp.]|nr:hypothetical protein [Nonomuraea sp.]